jgi:acetyl/propionyl-CoA carboxylase alpha subunit
MRYQKLIEESPSPFVDEDLRQELANAAIQVARSVGYINAGTLVFLKETSTPIFWRN